MSYPQTVLNRLPTADKSWFDVAAGHKRLASTLAGSNIREFWKYTPVKSFVEAFDVPQAATWPATSGLDQAHIQASRFAELTGDQLHDVRQALDDIDGERYPLADLAMLDSADGLFVKVTGQAAEPVTLKMLDGGCQIVFIEVAAGATLNLNEQALATGFNTQLIYLRLGVGSRVDHARCALEPAASHWSLLMAELESDSAYQLQQFQAGGQRRRTDCHVKLSGRGASVDLTGAFLTEDGCHLDQQVVIEHQAGDSVSRQKFHGIGTGKSRSIFNGRIHIHPDAGGSDAQLSNRNLSLTSGAEIDSKPELEIYTDDVRCAHGATVGQLSAESLFYLRSRGMSEAAARSLLCRGFLKECISGPLADVASERFVSALL
jgi:Fe-S cluster assembly protein SufD